jgi:hypothetical protein
LRQAIKDASDAIDIVDSLPRLVRIAVPLPEMFFLLAVIIQQRRAIGLEAVEPSNLEKEFTGCVLIIPFARED